MVVQFYPSFSYPGNSIRGTIWIGTALTSAYLASSSSIACVDRSLQQREATRNLLQFHLKRTQERMKHFADRKRSEQASQVGDMVYLKLQPYRQQSVCKILNQKLDPKYFGPFWVEAKMGSAVYRLQLPPDSRVHPTFHVLQLERCISNQAAQPLLPAMNIDGTMKKTHLNR